VAQALLRAFAAEGGHGIAAPSANRFGRISPTTAQHVRDDLGDDVAMIVDGGACEVGIESTIVAFTGDDAVLLRPGGIAEADLARVLGAPLRTASAHAPRASGTLASHYAPRTRSRLVNADELAAPANAAVLARTVPAKTSRWIAAPRDAAAYAHDLYANLRALDAMGAAEILIEDVPAGAAWNAVRDRLVRATHGEDDDRD
jgi:L-threonylcarbamoyladenylate synthase